MARRGARSLRSRGSLRTLTSAHRLAIALLAGAAGLAFADAGCSDDDTVVAFGSDAAVDTGVSLPAADASDVFVPSTDGAVSQDAAPDVVTDAPSGCADAGGGRPVDLACTGLYSDFASKTVAAANVAYAPGVILWSDGAEKSRWMFLPPGSQIDTTDMDEWVFPVGTRVWKEFRLGGKRIETRMLWKSAAMTWQMAAYRWNDDETSATLLDSGQQDAGGGYEVPEVTACPLCHNGHKDHLLGFEALALSLPGASGITLTTLVNDGRLTAPPAQTTLDFPGAAVDKAALGWLHINCGVPCHNTTPGSGAGFTGLWMRVSAKSYLDAGAAPAVTDLDTYTTTVNQIANAYVGTYPPDAGYRRIVPGDATHSVIPLVDGVRGPLQMPPIVTHKVDEAGVGSVIDWVNQL